MTKTLDEIRAEVEQLEAIIKDKIVLRDDINKRFRAAGIPPLHSKHSKRSAGTDLYFIQADAMVKIGRANYPSSRLETLQTGSAATLILVAEYKNMGDLEGECHKRLKHLRVRGEWFWFDDDVAALIRELNERSGKVICL